MNQSTAQPVRNSSAGQPQRAERLDLPADAPAATAAPAAPEPAAATTASWRMRPDLEPAGSVASGMSAPPAHPAQAKYSLTHPPISRHGDDGLAARVPLLHVAQALGRIGQGVRPVDDRRELPVLDEPGHR